MSETWPRLSELPGNHLLDQCAKCGGCHLLERWQEHDSMDKPEAKVVVLCRPCSDKLIEPHPRLYRRLISVEFVPGSSRVCSGCRWQVHLSCTSPKAKFNGSLGPGLEFEPRPTVALVDGTKYRGPVAFESVPVERCSGKELK